MGAPRQVPLGGDREQHTGHQWIAFRLSVGARVGRAKWCQRCGCLHVPLGLLLPLLGDKVPERYEDAPAPHHVLLPLFEGATVMGPGYPCGAWDRTELEFQSAEATSRMRRLADRYLRSVAAGEAGAHRLGTELAEAMLSTVLVVWPK